jgi:RimJ/RimL family protein N-acetyltransferase
MPEMHNSGLLFYRITIPVDRPIRSLPAGYSSEVWFPNLFRFKPNGLPAFPYGVWWAFHMLHVFANRDYSLLIIRCGDNVVHRSGITPRYFRFPFMAAEDIQIGDTWTDPKERGKGLATIALESILKARRQSRKTCWYVVESDNAASIRSAEKAGFALVGRGIRTSPWGVRVIGRYVLEETGPSGTPADHTEI